MPIRLSFPASDRSPDDLLHIEERPALSFLRRSLYFHSGVRVSNPLAPSQAAFAPLYWLCRFGGYGDKWSSEYVFRTRGRYPAPPPKPTRVAGFGGGEIGSTGDLKGVLLPGMIPPLSGQTYSC